MDNVYDFPDRSVIEREASDWLMKLDGDQPPSAQELEDLREWVHRSPVHRDELNELSLLWGKMNVLTELSVPLGTAGNPRDSGPKSRERTPVFSFGVTGLALAASLFGVAFTLFLTLGGATDDTLNGLYSTSIGQQKAIILPDGSEIQINTNSKIEVDYSSDFRNIHLVKGEAHFNVAKDPDKPFRVYAGNGRVQAVGTAFLVYLKDRDVSVTVAEGKVALSASEFSVDEVVSSSPNGPPDESITSSVERFIDGGVEDFGFLEAGQETRIRRVLDGNLLAQNVVEPIQKLNAPELHQRLSWREGLLVFSGEPLHAVVKEISRYTTLSISIVDPRVRNLRIGGQFKVGDTDAMFDALRANFNLKVTRVEESVVQISLADE